MSKKGKAVIEREGRDAIKFGGEDCGKGEARPSKEKERPAKIGGALSVNRFGVLYPTPWGKILIKTCKS